MGKERREEGRRKCTSLREKSAREDVQYELRRREKGGGGGGHESLRVAGFFGADERGRELEYVAGRAYREKGRSDLGGKTKETPPRWAMDVEVSVVGKFQGCPCFLSKTAHTTRRINRNKPMNNKLLAIEEDASLTEASLVNPGMFTERFEETYKALGGTGSLSEGEDGDLTWFNAGLRIGVGVGLGVCLGAGLGAGILVRSYQYTANSLKKRLF